MFQAPAEGRKALFDFMFALLRSTLAPVSHFLSSHSASTDSRPKITSNKLQPFHFFPQFPLSFSLFHHYLLFHSLSTQRIIPCRLTAWLCPPGLCPFSSFCTSLLISLLYPVLCPNLPSYLPFYSYSRLPFAIEEGGDSRLPPVNHSGAVIRSSG